MSNLAFVVVEGALDSELGEMRGRLGVLDKRVGHNKKERLKSEHSSWLVVGL